MKRVIAVIVLYKPDCDLLHAQYKSIKEQVSNIIYVENDTIVKGLERFSNTEVIHNTENVGLGKAQNQGIEAAVRLGADFILLLDQDSTLPVKMVSTLLREYEDLVNRGVNAAAICPSIFSDFTKEVCKVPVSLGLLVRTTYLKETQKVSYAISSGSLIPIDVMKKVGGIQEDFFIDSMDAEWCLRASHLGYDTYITPHTVLTHQLGNGAEKKVLQHSPAREYFIIRNSIALLKLPYVPVGFKIRRLLLSIGRVFYSLTHGYWNHFLQGLRGLGAGWFVNTNKYIYGA